MKIVSRKPFIEIVRHPYEEPYHLNLEVTASNGNQFGVAEFYVNASVLKDWGNALQEFPRQSGDAFTWEYGSESPEDKWAYYFRFHIFLRDSLGHGAINLRWNNNKEIPEREIFEFCIPAEIGGINRFGRLCLAFARLKHEVLFWTPQEDLLFATQEEAENSEFYLS